MTKETVHSTLYRAYRPRHFDEVRGQAHVVDVLQKAIRNKKIAHAYLFSGGRGTGKTSVARILARELGVSDKDLYEIDAASNTGVDNIRELREGVYAAPFDSPYKVYIIDEAHMLSKAAWNAFLKTLEEPPAHALFIMATTELHKVPDTIQSRCEIYRFKQPSREVLAEMIVDVARAEGYKLERSAAELVALLADGSFRDGLSILQKVLTVSGNKNIEVAEVEEVSGAPRSELIRGLIEGIARNDAGKSLAAIEKAVSANFDMRTLAKLLLHRLRVVLLLRHAPELAANMTGELSDADWELAAALAKDTSAAISSETLRTLLSAYGEMAYAAVPHLPLELAVVDLTTKD